MPVCVEFGEPGDTEVGNAVAGRAGVAGVAGVAEVAGGAASVTHGSLSGVGELSTLFFVAMWVGGGTTGVIVDRVNGDGRRCWGISLVRVVRFSGCTGM